MTREELIDHLSHLEKYTHYSEDAPALREVIEMLTERTQKRTQTHACDCISRQEAIDWCLEGLNNMPSARPEIIRCKDCKNSEHWYADRRRCFLWAEDGISVFDNGFCSYAERREECL